ncbi:MAG: hypothetical protein K6E50_02980 [Lachnospiraceae bacterium]|nr:hypothetical protein [Lachnospiraceae bacterium]
MKKRVLALLLAGVMAASSLTGCGEKEEPAKKTEDNKEEDEPEEEPEEKKPAEDEKEVSAFDGIWIRDKTHDRWVVIKGSKWHEVDYNGEASSDEKVEYREDGKYADLIDSDGSVYLTFSIAPDGGLFDETFQETYSPEDKLPDVFPGQAAATLGFDDIADGWYYEVIDPDNLTDYVAQGTIQIEADGTYTMCWNDGDVTTGTILIEYAENPDGSSYPVYSFFAGGNNLWIAGTYDESEPQYLWIGNGGMERLVRGGRGDEFLGQGRMEFEGMYTDPDFGRSTIEIISQDGIHYSIDVEWASSHDETSYWEIADAVYNESEGVLEYSGAKFYVRTGSKDDVKYTNGSGTFFFDDDGMLNWISDNSKEDGVDGSTVFEKLPW